MSLVCGHCQAELKDYRQAPKGVCKRCGHYVDDYMYKGEYDE